MPQPSDFTLSEHRYAAIPKRLESFLNRTEEYDLALTAVRKAFMLPKKSPGLN
jgi:hypothetical protein